MAYRRNTRVSLTAVGGKQVQANWNETDPNSPAYIANKPDVSGALTRQVVDELPTEDIDPNCIYMVPDDDHYDEYMYINGNWEQIGSTQVEQVQSDWTEADPTSPAFIDNKPSLATVATSGDYTDLTNTPTLATVATSGDYDDLTNKPTIPAAQVNSDWNASTGVSQILNKPSLATVATSGDYTDLSNTPSLATVATTGDYDDLTNKPALATVATSGDYSDLSNTPTIPAAQVNSDWNASTGVAEILNKPSLATVATSGAYSDLTGTPTLATVATTGDYDDLTNKPTIPTVNDATITIEQNGTTVGSFTTNQGSNATITLTGGATQVNSDWNATSGVAEILNKPSLATVATTGAYSDLSGTPTLATVATTGDYDDLTNKPTIPAAQVNSDWNSSTGVSQILNKPSLATVATTGAYSDLSGTPSLATVATSGDYDDLSNKPTIPTVNDGTVSFYNGINNSLGSITMNQSTHAIVDIKPATQTVTGTPAYIATAGGKVYKCNTNLTALVVSSAENNSVEALIYFHTSVSGCTLTLPNSLDMVVGNTTLVADKDYIISIKDNVAIIINASDLLAPVAYSGSYSDLSNTPTIPAAQVNSDWNSSTGVSEILNKPSNLVFGSLFGSPASYTIMYISQSDYDNLGTYYNHTIYMIY